MEDIESYLFFFHVNSQHERNSFYSNILVMTYMLMSKPVRRNPIFSIIDRELGGGGGDNFTPSP